MLSFGIIRSHQKWVFWNERGTFWNQVIRGKYGEERGGRCSWEVRDEYGVGLWKTIKNEWHLVSNRLFFAVGGGRRVKFWKDKRCGPIPLCDSFPTLYALVVSKGTWVKDVWSFSNGGGFRALSSLDHSMVGRWMRWRVSCCVWMGRECRGMGRIGCFGRRQRVASSQLSLSTNP